jgi:hypothetical protein
MSGTTSRAIHDADNRSEPLRQRVAEHFSASASQGVAQKLGLRHRQSPSGALQFCFQVVTETYTFHRRTV